MNLATVIVLLVVLALVALAIWTLRRGKGSCSCGADMKKGGCSGCASCQANCPLKPRRGDRTQVGA